MKALNMSKSTIKISTPFIIGLIALTFLLAGCAGKKSSGTGSNEFSSWSGVNPNVTYHFSNGNSTVVSTSGTVSQSNTSVNANILLDAGYNISLVTLNQNATNAVTFSVAAGDTIVKDSLGANSVFTNQKVTTIGILANPTYYGYQYQTYGAWGAWGNAGVGGNAVSVGNITSAGNIPTSGSATFTGGANGYLIDGLRNSYVTSASMMATVDFAARQVAFSTSGTTIVGKTSGTATAISGLNLTGNMSYAAGSNTMTGSVTSASGMSGSMIANFYGPAANEIGGTYGLTQTTTGNSLVGGFGGKR